MTRRSALGAALVFGSLGGALAARKKKRRPPPTAVLAGTAFRGLGFSFPGVDITVVNKAAPGKELRGITDGRGEFAIHVPAGEAVYVVTAKAKGFEPLKKEVEIYGMERITVNFRMTSNERRPKK